MKSKKLRSIWDSLKPKKSTRYKTSKPKVLFTLHKKVLYRNLTNNKSTLNRKGQATPFNNRKLT